jgi:multicomponent Na+:H+ antiporter subunit D
MFGALAFCLLILSGKYPPEIRAINLDTDWFYRKGARAFADAADAGLNRLNAACEGVLASRLPQRIGSFFERLPGLLVCFVSRAAGSEKREAAGSGGCSIEEAEAAVRGGLLPVGLSALLAAVLFVVLFLML